MTAASFWLVAVDVGLGALAVLLALGAVGAFVVFLEAKPGREVWIAAGGCALLLVLGVLAVAGAIVIDAA